MKRLPIFDTVSEALAALNMDKLGTVYHRGRKVFVATAFGTGTFSREDWEHAVAQCGMTGGIQESK
jgi:hypothetical protein